MKPHSQGLHNRFLLPEVLMLQWEAVEEVLMINSISSSPHPFLTKILALAMPPDPSGNSSNQNDALLDVSATALEKSGTESQQSWHSQLGWGHQQYGLPFLSKTRPRISSVSSAVQTVAILISRRSLRSGPGSTTEAPHHSKWSKQRGGDFAVEEGRNEDLIESRSAHRYSHG
ncbi:hypothetical protein HPP92_024939 [Vanilla planifolia]|uniref:Uncharacterized protein n=1 Tax=Vanilla planifolia TaxID=51239 RepID=A0A835PGY0_VANPL|nr:hypothetical protein HPP92_024939 [Vanilla planifolia]